MTIERDPRPLAAEGPLDPTAGAFTARSVRRQRLRLVCSGVRQLTAEMLQLASERTLARRDSRRATCHTRQIAMYVCHVALQISQSDIGLAFGRDRTTVSHACGVVEDRRDDADFDAFVAAVERVALSAFGMLGGLAHEGGLAHD